MNTYYYDKEARVLLAVGEDASVRILEPVPTSAQERPAELSFQGIPVKVTKEAPQFAKGCSECGSKSRHRKECSRAGGDGKATKRRRGEPCPECESISSRHKKGCSLGGGNAAWAALDEEEQEKSRKGLMTERQYGQVKTAHQHGMDPTSIAHEMNLTVKEVNTAVLSRSFDVYSSA